MSQTLTKPILLDETGQAIKTALQNIDETESQDWLLTYEDVHSEMDDNVDRIADALEGIKDLMTTGSWYPDYIWMSIYPNWCYVGDTFGTFKNGIKVYAMMIQEQTSETIIGQTVKQVDITNSCSFNHKSSDMMGPANSTITATWIYGKTGKEYTVSQDITVNVPPFEWGGEYVTKALNAHYAGLIDLTDYWSVGDECQVFIDGALYNGDNAYYAGESPKRACTLVLMNAGGKELVTPINGHTECAFIVGLKEIIYKIDGLGGTYLGDTFYYDKYKPDDGYLDTDYDGNWEVSDLRDFCNNTLKDKFYYSTGGTGDPDVKIIWFKEFYNITGDACGSANTVRTADWFAEPSEKEVTGETYYANATAEASLSQFEWYEDILNRNNDTKFGPVSANRGAWFTRSVGVYKLGVTDYTIIPAIYGGSVHASTQSYSNPNTKRYISPFGVI